VTAAIPGLPLGTEEYLANCDRQPGFCLSFVTIVLFCQIQSQFSGASWSQFALISSVPSEG
jgi:hypothetical protein